MRRVGVFLLGGLLLAPTAAWAGEKTGKVSCVGVHVTPNLGAQIKFQFLGFTNHDLENPATIERITFRDSDGVVLYDQGPNADFPFGAPPSFGDLNVTPVPPGGHRVVNTITIFGFDAVGLMLAEVEWSKEGDENLFLVRSLVIVAERISLGGDPENFTVGNQVATKGLPCVDVN